MRDQEVDHAARRAHRHVPMRLGRQPQLRPGHGRIPGPAIARIDRIGGAGHLRPLQQAEAAHRVRIDRILGQHQHSVLPRMQAIAPGIVAARASRSADLAIVVQVQATGHAGVDLGQIAVGIAQRRAAAGLGDFEETMLEQIGRALRRVVVELVEQHQIGPHDLQHRGDLARVRAVAFQFGDQPAGLVRIQRGVVGRHPQRGRGGGRHGGIVRAAGKRGQGHQAEQGSQSHRRILCAADDTWRLGCLQRPSFPRRRDSSDFRT